MRRAVVVAVALLLLVSGCAASRPDATEWRDHARQALDDVASEVATARLTLTQLAEGRLPASYGVTVLVEAEAAAATAEESLANVQPPPGVAARSDRVLAIIAHALDAVQRAREAVVAEHYDQPALVAELRRLQASLDERRAAL